MAFRDPEFEYYQNFYNKANETSARKQNEFQKMMSDTSHQREVADLLKAGLNPALSLNNGASSPNGAYANIDSTSNTARSQMAVTKKEIEAQMKMNNASLINAYKIAKYQSMVQERMNKYNTDMSYALGMYQAGLGYDASIYGSDMQQIITQMGIDNPNNLYGMLREIFKGLIPDDGSGSSSGSGSSGRGVKTLTNQIIDSAKNLVKGLSSGKKPKKTQHTKTGKSKTSGKSSGRGTNSNSARKVSKKKSSKGRSSAS